MSPHRQLATSLAGVLFVVAGGLMLSGCGDDEDGPGEWQVETKVVTVEGQRFACFGDDWDGVTDCEPLEPR